MSGRLAALGLSLLLAASLVWQVDRTRDRLQAQRVLKAVQVVTGQMSASGRSIPRVLWQHVRLLEDAEELDPSDPALPLARGSQYLLLDRPEEAIEAYETALALENRPEIHLNLGRVHSMAGDDGAAREHFETAVALAPHLRRLVPRQYR